MRRCWRGYNCTGAQTEYRGSQEREGASGGRGLEAANQLTTELAEALRRLDGPKAMSGAEATTQGGDSDEGQVEVNVPGGGEGSRAEAKGSKRFLLGGTCSPLMTHKSQTPPCIRPHSHFTHDAWDAELLGSLGPRIQRLGVQVGQEWRGDRMQD